MPIVNLTPHPITLVAERGHVTIPPSGVVARVAREDVTLIASPVRITRSRFGAVEGLPEAQAGVFYLVSGLLMAAAPGRPDLLAPGELLRDAEGRVIGAASLIAAADVDVAALQRELEALVAAQLPPTPPAE